MQAGFEADQVQVAGRFSEYTRVSDEADKEHVHVACCESLAGRTADAVEHLRQALDMWEGCRDMAKGDSDFDPIRDEPAFEELIGR
jgi:hypothetical protein